MVFKIIKVENVLANVDDIDEAKRYFSKLLGITFESHSTAVLPDGMEVKITISPHGIELIEQTKPRLASEGMRGFSLRVSNLDEAKLHLKKMGLSPIVEFQTSNLKEAIYHIRGIRMAFEEHSEE